MILRHHPDGFIYLADLCLPLEFFQAQEPAYALPEGAIAQEYDPEIPRRLLRSGDSQWAGELPWEEGDRFLAQVETYRAAWELANLPAPTPASQSYSGFYGGLLSEALPLFLKVRSLADSNLPVSNSYTDLMGAIGFGQWAGFQSSIANLVLVMAAVGQPFTPEDRAMIRSVLDKNGFQEVVLP